jgi:hypothetical protein
MNPRAPAWRPGTVLGAGRPGVDRPRGTRTGLTGAVVLGGLLALVAWSAVNAERLVVEGNVARPGAGARGLDRRWHRSVTLAASTRGEVWRG